MLKDLQLSPLPDYKAKWEKAQKTLWVYRLVFAAFIALFGYATVIYFEITETMERAEEPEWQWKQMVKEGTELIERPDPRSPSRGYAIRAYSKIRLRDFEAGKEDLAEARAVDGQYHRPQHYFYSAFALAEYGLHDDAVELLELAVSDFPQEPDVLRGYAKFLAYTRNDTYRDTSRAVGLYGKAMELDPAKDRYEHWQYAIVLAADGKTAEAIEQIKKALSLPAASEKSAAGEDEKLRKKLSQLENGTYKHELSQNY